MTSPTSKLQTQHLRCFNSRARGCPAQAVKKMTPHPSVPGVHYRAERPRRCCEGASEAHRRAKPGNDCRWCHPSDRCCAGRPLRWCEAAAGALRRSKPSNDRQQNHPTSCINFRGRTPCSKTLGGSQWKRCCSCPLCDAHAPSFAAKDDITFLFAASTASPAEFPWENPLPTCQTTIRLVHDASFGWKYSTHQLYPGALPRQIEGSSVCCAGS